MAKVTPSALITAIQGKWNGSCFQMWKNKIVVRRNPMPRFPNKASRARYKGVISSISSCHYKLTADQKIAWDTYSDLLPTSMTGFNAFMSRNSVLLLAQHPDLKIYFDAPEAYSPPMGPAPIGLCYYPSTGHYCLFWNNPNCAGVYVQGKYSVQTGYSNQKSPSWRMFNTVVSTALHMDFDASKFPVDIMMRFTALAINMDGEVSLMAEAKPPPPMPPDLYVYTPNGSERYYVGSSHWIEWRSINISTIQIDYSINSGDDWINITPAAPGPAGKYLWTIPDVSSSLCLIKISDISDPSNYDTSNAVFRILTTPTIDVTSPDGGEEWEIASKHNITWDQTDCTNVKIQFSIDGGDQFQTIIDSTPAAAGTYEWTIPDHESAQCYVKILCVEDLAIYNSSFNPFSIIEPVLPGDCVAWWLFKTAGYDAGNTRFTDQTGNGHHANNNNGSVGADYTTMNGTTSYLDIDDFLELSADRKHFSVFTWLNGTDASGGVIEHWYLASHQDSWQIFLFMDKAYFVVSNTVDASAKKYYYSNLPVHDGSIHSLGFSFNNGVFKVYIDGEEDTDVVKQTDDAFTTLYNSTHPIHGCYREEAGGAYEYLATKLYKTYLYKKTLSPAEFAVLHDLGG